MKISVKQASDLLKKLGANVQLVEKDDDADKDANIDEIAEEAEAAIVEAQKPGILQEAREEFGKEFAGMHGKNAAKTFASKFGMNKKDLEGKTLDQIADLLNDKIKADGGKEQSERELELEEMLKGKDTEMGELQKQLEASNQKYIDRDIKSRCMSIVEKLPRKGGDLEEQAAMLESRMRANYDLKYNDQTKTLEFWKDGKQVLEKNKPITDEGFATGWAEKAGILTSDTRHVAPADINKKDVKPGIETIQPQNNRLGKVAEWANAGS